MCASLKRFDCDVTAPWNSASVSCPEVEEIVKWMETPVVPKPRGAFQVRFPNPFPERPIAVEQFMAGDRNDAEKVAFCTYGPLQLPRVAVKTKVCFWASVGCKPGVAMRLPDVPWHAARGSCSTAEITNGPTAFLAPAPRMFTAETAHV